MYRLAALALLAGCGDNLAGFAIEDVSAALESARCERLVRCGVFPDVAACTTRIRARSDQDLLAAVAEGSVRYRPELIAECLAELSTASCNDTNEDVRVTPACEALFGGERAPGVPCVLDEQCGSLRCERTGCQSGTCCEGTCAAFLVGDGGACDVDADCSSGFWCSDATCRPLALAGEACRADRQCAYGAACVGAGIDPGFCRDLPLVGERCPYRRCAEVGARCAMGTCVAAGPGAACATDADCTEFGVCDSRVGECRMLPVLGEACETVCSGESYCERTINPPTCNAPLPLDVPCATDDQCESTFCEEGAFFNQCKPLPVCT